MRIVTILLFLFSVSLYSQSVNHNSDEFSSSSNISKVFTPIVLDAYQEQAKSKINDFYSYLNLWNKEDNLETKNEIKVAIKRLFVEDIKFQNFLNNGNTDLTLDQFLEKIKKEKSQFTISKIELDKIQGNFFEMKYTLTINNLDASNYNLLIDQKVFLLVEIKSFGTNKKRVWQLRMGEFSF
ncbi:MAG: hypothetical protein QM535_10995 [Limnohabitans sp.]|nr:hypothetical protein [Limnohabitans sp.]